MDIGINGCVALVDSEASAAECHKLDEAGQCEAQVMMARTG